MSRAGDGSPGSSPGCRDSANRTTAQAHRVRESRQISEWIGKAGVAGVLFSIDAYRRLVSPFLPPSCRYEPSCSQYAREAVKRYGALRGLRMAAVRLLRCHPFHPGGWDPVP